MLRIALGLIFGGLLSAAVSAEKQPMLAIIIDDLGNNLSRGEQALKLPGQITYSILPNVRHSHRLAMSAKERGKELMLHLPMESLGNEELGPGGLTGDMSPDVLTRLVRDSLASIPYVSGVSNHMGSSLTQNKQSMQDLMDILRREGGLYFIDSRTHSNTVAEQVAREAGVSTARRDIFLDHEVTKPHIQAQLKTALWLARKNGSAIAIGHPYAETLAVLEQELPKLQQQGILLAPVSKIIQQQNRNEPWPAFSSHSHKVARSSKQ